jgi:hypothetical protein
MVAISVVALVARLAFVAVVAAVHKGPLIPDEQQYIDLATTVARGHSADEWATGYGQSLYTSTWLFSGVLRLLFWVFWPTRVIGQLVAASAGVVAAALTVRLAREVVSARWALAAGAVVALLPSQVLWSSVSLRESLVWASIVGIAVAVAAAVRPTPNGAEVLALLGAGALLLGLGFLRDQTMVAAAWAIPLAVVLAAPAATRRRLVAVSLGVFLAVPWLAGNGPAGASVIETSVPALGRWRAQLATDAASGFALGRPSAPASTTTAPPGVTTSTAVDGAPQPGQGASEDEAGSEGSGAAARPPAGPGSSGPIPGGTSVASTTTLPPVGAGQSVVVSRSGAVYVVDEGATADLKALPRGAVAVLLRPFPWEQAGTIPLRFAAVEDLGWYVLYALAVVGMVVSRRRGALAFPALAGGAILFVAFLTQGNLGTAFRHREQVLPFLVVAAAAGAAAVVDRGRGVVGSG